jgi:KUP system potassium uptake protein
MDSLPGVYGAIYYLGYREYVDVHLSRISASIEISFPRVTVQIDEIIQRIYALELCINPDGAQEVIRQLSAVASRYTHMYVCLIVLLPFDPTCMLCSLPYYDFVSRPVRNGFLAPIRNKIRTFLIEDIYRRLCMSSSTHNSLTS